MLMIAGNPKAGRKIAALALALLIVIVLILTLAGLRRRNAPVSDPPLHPSTLIWQLNSSAF